MDRGAWQADLGLALGSPIFPSSCVGKLGVALESLQEGVVFNNESKFSTKF